MNFSNRPKPRWSLSWKRKFTEEEFQNKIRVNNVIENIDGVKTINNKYNSVEFNPFDGELINAADKFAAFLEAWNSCSSGIKSDDLIGAMEKIRNEFENDILGNVELRKLYSQFEKFEWRLF